MTLEERILSAQVGDFFVIGGIIAFAIIILIVVITQSLHYHLGKDIPKSRKLTLFFNNKAFNLDNHILELLTSKDNRPSFTILAEALFIVLLLAISFLRLNQNLTALNSASSDLFIDFLTTNWWSGITISKSMSKALFFFEFFLYIISPLVIKDKVFSKALSFRGVFYSLIILFKVVFPWILNRLSINANDDLAKQLFVFLLQNLNIASVIAAIILLYIFLSFKMVNLFIHHNPEVIASSN